MINGIKDDTSQHEEQITVQAVSDWFRSDKLNNVKKSIKIDKFAWQKN